MYTEEFVSELINCSKRVIDPPKALKIDRGNFKTNFTLQSVDGKYNFYAFIRKNEKFPENFSVGLDYNPREEKGTIQLLRCNGPHGEHVQYPHHIVCHIHKATADRINSGLKPEGNFEITNRYATLEDALQFYINYVNIIADDKIKYFPPSDLELEFLE